MVVPLPPLMDSPPPPPPERGAGLPPSTHIEVVFRSEAPAYRPASPGAAAAPEPAAAAAVPAAYRPASRATASPSPVAPGPAAHPAYRPGTPVTPAAAAAAAASLATYPPTSPRAAGAGTARALLSFSDPASPGPSPGRGSPAGRPLLARSSGRPVGSADSPSVSVTVLPDALAGRLAAPGARGSGLAEDGSRTLIKAHYTGSAAKRRSSAASIIRLQVRCHRRARARAGGRSSGRERGGRGALAALPLLLAPG